MRRVTTDLTTPLAALAAGIVASLHCAGMCAPLTCALFRSCPGSKTAAYHATRVVTYTLLGAVLGGTGSAAAGIFANRISAAAPLALVAIFLAMAFGLDRNFPIPGFVRRVIAAPRAPMGGAWLGLVTPLIPCGPLYLMLGVSLISGSPVRGGEMMLAFALGTLPIYILAQWQWFRLSTSLSPVVLRNTQRILACVSAALVAWRTVANGGLGLANAVCH